MKKVLVNDMYEGNMVFSGNRSTFFAKVFSILGLSVVTTIAGVFLGIFLMGQYPSFFVNTWFFYGVFAVELILIFTSQRWSQIQGLNYILFIAFTLLSGFTLVPILIMAQATGGIALIMKALVATLCMFAGTAIYGFITKKDLSGMRGFLMVSLIGIILSSIVNIFIGSQLFDYVLSWIVVIVFAGMTMYDMQMIKNHYHDNMFIMAAIALYLDFFNMFVHILSIMMRGRE